MVTHLVNNMATRWSHLGHPSHRNGSGSAVLEACAPHASVEHHHLTPTGHHSQLRIIRAERGADAHDGCADGRGYVDLVNWGGAGVQGDDVRGAVAAGAGGEVARGGLDAPKCRGFSPHAGHVPCTASPEVETKICLADKRAQKPSVPDVAFRFGALVRRLEL
jgi:hypothetical protein